MNYLRKNNIKNKVLYNKDLMTFRNSLNTFLSDKGYKTIDSRNKHKKPFNNKPLIGIIDNAQMLPIWYNKENGKELKKEIFNSIKYLILFSKSNIKNVNASIGIKIFIHLHPLPISTHKWSFEDYKKTENPGIIQVEIYQRCINAIFMLPSKGMKKILLHSSKHKRLDNFLNNERKYLGNEFRKPQINTVEVRYEKNILLENWYNGNIFFLHLYDATIDWVVLKCIADNVPILINHLPSIHEYLGNDYPMYYSNYYEACEKANNAQIIYNTHIYLKERCKLETFTSKNFFKELSTFIINKQ